MWATTKLGLHNRPWLRQLVFLGLIFALAASIDSDNAFTDTDRIVPEILFDEVQMEVAYVASRAAPRSNVKVVYTPELTAPPCTAA